MSLVSVRSAMLPQKTCTMLSSSRSTADLLLSYVHTVAPGLSPQTLLRLEFGEGLEESDELATDEGRGRSSNFNPI